MSTTRALVAASSVLALGLGPAAPRTAHAEGALPNAMTIRVTPVSSTTFGGVEADAMPSFLPGQIVVDVRDDLSEDAIADLGREYGLVLRDNSPDIKDDGKIELTTVDAQTPPELLERLAKDPRVEGVEPQFVYKALFTPNDPKFAEQWHMARVGAEKGWEYACGEGVTVAVVDTGIACYDDKGFAKGTDLAGTACVDGYNFVSKNAVAADDQGHGTHVAGTIAQTTNNGIGVAGLAHCAKLMPVKVLSGKGWGTMADVAEGIRWAADHGAQVINLSLGSSQKSGVVHKAVQHALAKGVVVVAAAGNSGGSVGYPAAYDGVIAVSATDKNDAIAWFSSRGPEVTIGAPGVGVTQQTICEAGKNKCEQWGVFNGTSMASPHVAAAAALLVGQGITHPDAVKAALVATATPKEDTNLFGAGILEAGRAVVRTHWMHVATRLAALFGLFALVARRIRKRGGSVEKGAGKWLGALAFGVGLAPFLPLAGIPARAGALRWASELAMKPIGEWTLFVSPKLHSWLPLASALPAVALTALFFGVKRLRPFAGGVALGSAALMTQLAVSGETWFALGPFGLRLFAAANVAVCLWLARMSLDAKRT
jgi:serine protease